MNPVSLPKAAKEAADSGDLLNAINITQETMGVGLQDAQQAVHAYVKGHGSITGKASTSGAAGVSAGMHGPAGGLPPQALAALHRGNLIEAIKHTRSAHGLGLKEAKDSVENYLARNPMSKQHFENALRQGGPNMAPVFGVLVLVLIAAGAIAGYLFIAKTG